MKCVDAFWEKRNLGCNTIEIEIEKEDSINNIIGEIDDLRAQYNAEYIVVKANTNFTVPGRILQDNDFWLIETQIGTKKSRGDAAKAIAQYASLYEGVKCKKVTSDEEVDLIIKEIKKGIFNTDRIALDEVFGIDIAQKRYANWLLDAMKQGAELFLIQNEGCNIGFLQQKRDSKGKLYVNLLGMFLGEEIHGTGDMIYYAGTKLLHDSNVAESRGAVSANNLVAVKLDFMFGSRPYSFKNVFVKHY